MAHSIEQVRANVKEAFDAGVDVLLMEMIPGPDNLLCSYYTYLDESGQPTFDLTKRGIRMDPVNMGIGTYHVTEYIPSYAPRDGDLSPGWASGTRGRRIQTGSAGRFAELIECNARFTAANRLLSVAGFDVGRWVYYRIIGRPRPVPAAYPATTPAALLKFMRRRVRLASDVTH